MLSWKNRKRLETLGLGAFFAVFMAGITVNAVPDIAIAFEGLYCPAGTTVETGMEAGRRPKSGPVGFAHCVDGSGATTRDIMFPVFLTIFVGATAVCTAGVAMFMRSRGR